MYSHKEFEILAQEISESFNLGCESIHKNIRGFHVEGAKDDILRLIYVEAEKKIGLAFHIETQPTDAISIFNYVIGNSMKSEKKGGVSLLHSYFQDELGNIYSGIDARYAVEQSRQDHYLQVFSKSPKEEIEKHLKRIEGNKEKITWN